MRFLLVFSLLVFAACTRPSTPEPGGAIGDLLRDNQSGRGDGVKGEPEGTPAPKKEK